MGFPVFVETLTKRISWLWLIDIYRAIRSDLRVLYEFCLNKKHGQKGGPKAGTTDGKMWWWYLTRIKAEMKINP